MRAILENDELTFLGGNHELLKDYMNNGLIFETIMMCTKRQLSKSNYLEKFNDVFECIRRKMWQLCETSERGSAGSIPGVIDEKIIMRALVRGYNHLKSRLETIANYNGKNLNNLEHKKELGMTLVLIILARVNLDNNFT